jgi:hypothetical protein
MRPTASLSKTLNNISLFEMKSLRMAILSHSAATRPDAIVDWAFDRGHAPNVCALYKGEPCPEVEEFDFLVSTGGPMNCFEDERFPFLADEAKLLERAIVAGKGVLGLCLGGQLIARAAAQSQEARPLGSRLAQGAPGRPIARKRRNYGVSLASRHL